MNFEPTSEHKAFYNAARTIVDLVSWGVMLNNLKETYPNGEEEAFEDMIWGIQDVFPFHENGPSEMGGEKADEIFELYSKGDGISFTEAAALAGLNKRVSIDETAYFYKG